MLNPFKWFQGSSQHPPSSLSVITGCRFGPLENGFGFSFGPFKDTKDIKKDVHGLFELFPLNDSNFSTEIRLLHLRVLIGLFTGSWGQDKKKIKYLGLSFRFSPPLKIAFEAFLKRLEKIPASMTQGDPPFCFPSKSGLIVMTNIESKDLDLFVVVNNQIKQILTLPMKNQQKLSSPRYLTRLFEPHIKSIEEPLRPQQFTPEVCENISLLGYWFQSGADPAQWKDFSEIQPLLNKALL